MNRLVIALLLTALLVSAGSAQAAPGTPGGKSILRVLGTSAVGVPPEWEGDWSHVDSTYDCTGVLQDVSSGEDTLCAGEETYRPPDTGVALTCNGTADATTVHVVCTGSSDLIPDCTASYVVHMDGTRTADSYFVVTVIEVTYSGTAEGCDLVPPTCIQLNTHGTRVGPAPPTYCATPTQPTTWGRLKTLYR